MKELDASFEILLTTLNARFHHSAFGLRYLYANLRELQPRSRILEFTINQNPRDIVEKILSMKPRLVGFGVYIWNTEPTYEVVSILKRVAPEITVVLGGPEVSFETQSQAIARLADYVIQGESDFLFYEFCRKFMEGAFGPRHPDGKAHVISGDLPEVGSIASPYPHYTDEDIRHRVIYVEASRGCPYKCEYCLSSLDKSVRNFDLDRFLADLDQLIARGARQFKFIDRTFNLSVSISSRILRFFLDRMHHGLFLHFEMVPDRLPSELRELIREFPRGALQFEIGIQTWSPEVARLVSRRNDYSKVRENFRFLAEETGVHTHADLIVGLPGETLESFGHGFDELWKLKPDEIQVGMLKRLKGTPIIRHDQEWAMVYQESAPFQILSTRTMDFLTLQKMARFSQFWDLYANSGNFRETVGLLEERSGSSFFRAFFEFSEYLSVRHPHGSGIALLNLVESAWVYLTEVLAVDRETAREILIRDYSEGAVKRDIPRFLKDSNRAPAIASADVERANAVPRRQRRHLS